MRIQRSAVALAVTVAASFGIAMASPAAAHADSVHVPVPGDPNCLGQLTAYVAQGNPTGFLTANGIGNVAAVNGASVTDVHNLIAAYCAA
jgi:hypothetical protein